MTKQEQHKSYKLLTKKVKFQL